MTALADVQTILSEDDLLRLGAEMPPFEVIDGEIINMSPVGILHQLIAGNAYHLLHDFVKENKQGYVFFDSLIFVLERDPERGVRRTRIPDVSFIKKGRFPKEFDLSKPFPGAPDLAVEVISADESAATIRAKVRDYLHFGSTQVWLLYPDEKELHLYRQAEQNTSRIFQAEETFDAAEVLPGLQVPIQNLFTLPEIE